MKHRREPIVGNDTFVAVLRSFGMVYEPNNNELEELHGSIEDNAAALLAFDLYVAALDALGEAREEDLKLEPFELEVCVRRGELDYLLGRFV